MKSGTTRKRLLRPLMLTVGALAIVAVFFFGTLYLLDNSDPTARNQLRAEHARVLKSALANYRKAKGAYPVLSDVPVDDLKKELVDGKFIIAIPSDPLRPSTGVQYRYVSDGGVYGLLFVLEPVDSAAGKSAGGRCLQGVGTKGTGYWGEPPNCPF
jgi:hypothetical protein